MRSFLLWVASLSIFLAPLPAWALDIDTVEIFWLKDSVDGSPILNPFEFEIVVFFNDSTGLGAVELVSPGAGGTVALDEFADEWGTDPGVLFASSADLFTGFPSGASYTLNFLDAPSLGGGTVIDFFTITLSPVEVTNTIDITAPAHQSVVPVDQSVTWTNCSACDGTTLGGFLIDEDTDTDTDEFFTSDLTTVAWSPTGMLYSTSYGFEMILANYTHPFTPETSNLGDAFWFLSGFENINMISVTSVPEPGGLAALESGIAMLALLYRRRRYLIGR